MTSLMFWSRLGLDVPVNASSRLMTAVGALRAVRPSLWSVECGRALDNTLSALAEAGQQDVSTTAPSLLLSGAQGRIGPALPVVGSSVHGSVALPVGASSAFSQRHTQAGTSSSQARAAPQPRDAKLYLPSTRGDSDSEVELANLDARVVPLPDDS